MLSLPSTQKPPQISTENFTFSAHLLYCEWGYLIRIRSISVVVGESSIVRQIACVVEKDDAYLIKQDP
jgi:hypothetical protein